MTCPNVDINDPSQTEALYQQFLSSGFNTPALEAQASQELDDGLQALYGTTDKATVVAIWLNDASTVPPDGTYGLSHAALTLLALEAIRQGGGTTAQIQVESDRQVAYWYAREAIARCNDGVVDWLNPSSWNEDSRLDYMAVVLFVEWYMGQL